MSRLFSHSLPRDIFNISREIRMLTSPDSLSYSSEIRDTLPLHLPDVRTPAQCLIDLGLRPVLAQRLSSVYMDFVARYRQVFELYFRRVIHGGCQHPEYYRDIFVVQFNSTVQAWESQIMSTAWVWLCRAGLSPTSFSLDVRVDGATKTQILSKLSRIITSLGNNEKASAIGPSEEEYNTEGDFSTKMLPASPPSPLKWTITSTRDPFSQEMSSTCFPACYPPPPGEPISLPRKHLVTQFLFTTPAKNVKQYADRSVDMSSLVTDLGRMSVTTSGVDRKAQENRKYVWIPRSKKPEPLSPLLSPIVAGVSASPLQPQSPNTMTIPNAKSIAAPRKRRIAALPTRHTKATTVPISNPVSPPTPNPPPASDNPTQHEPISQVTRASVTEGTLIGCVMSSPSTVQYVPLSQASFTTVTSDIPRPKPALSGRGKKPPLLRRVARQSQTPPLPRRPPTPLAPSGQKIPFSNISRTPSLVSDTSSCADPLSSSDEFDTPSPTPPPQPIDTTSNALDAMCGTTTALPEHPVLEMISNSNTYSVTNPGHGSAVHVNTLDRQVFNLVTEQIQEFASPRPNEMLPSDSPPASNNAMRHKPISQVTRASVTEGTPIGCVMSSLSTVQYVPPSQASSTTGTSDIPGSKPALSEPRKKSPLLRRVASHSQTPPLPRRSPTPLAPSGHKIPFSNISRTPSLVSDTSSCADPHSSSDEFDTPPSTPPPHSHDLTSCNALVTSVISSKSNSTRPFGLPMLANVDYPDPRKGKGIHIDFTNGDAVGERQLNFTFRA